ncbi:DUF5658 family protein [Gudongella oleilytica]
MGAFNIVDYLLTVDFLDYGLYEVNPFMASTIGTCEFTLLNS